MIGGLASLLYVYAGLSQEGEIYVSDTQSLFSDKETFFYIALGVLAIQNFAFYALSKNIKYRNSNLTSLLVNWFLSFAFVLNFFYVVMINFIFLINSDEKFNFDNYGFLTFFSLGLIVVWLLALPVLTIRQIKK